MFEAATRWIFGIIGLVLMLLAAGLVVYAIAQVLAVFRSPGAGIGTTMLDSIGYMVIAIAVFEVAKYILEEEVIDPTEMRHAGEARRSITKFVSTISIAVFLEALVAIFQSSKDPGALDQMLYPTLLLFAGVALIVGLGAYQRLSASAERDIRASPQGNAEEQAELKKPNKSASSQ
jgi:hypothetical protein